MPGIQHIQEDRHYNSQPTKEDIIKAAHFVEVFFYKTKFRVCRRSSTNVTPISKFLLVTTSELIHATVNTYGGSVGIATDYGLDGP